MTNKKRPKTLSEKYPPSQPCSCVVCRAYCKRPGWWTVEQAARAIKAGYGARMMLELSPDRRFGVLSPAFLGCEGGIALQEYASNGCCFLENGLCELHGTGHEPIECLYCHHLRSGKGQSCHTDLEKDWKTPAGQTLVKTWLRAMKKTVDSGGGVK